MVQTVGVLQTGVRHQECPSLRDHEDHREEFVNSSSINNSTAVMILTTLIAIAMARHYGQ